MIPMRLVAEENGVGTWHLAANGAGEAGPATGKHCDSVCQLMLWTTYKKNENPGNANNLFSKWKEIITEKLYSLREFASS